MNRLRLITVPIVMFGLVVGSTAGAPAAVAGEPRSVPLDTATLPALVSNASGLSLRAASSAKELSPKHTRFTTRARETATTRVTVEAEADRRVEKPTLRYEQVGGPDGGSVGVRPAGGAAGAWRPGQPLPLDKGIESLEWTFDHSGTYTIRMVATAERTNTVPAKQAATDEVSADDAEPAAPETTSEQVSVTTDFVVEVAAADETAAPPVAEAEAGSIEAEAEESSSTETADGDPVEQAAAAAAERGPRPMVGAASEAGRSIVLTKGHIDLFEVTFADDELQLSVKDDTNLYGTGAQYRSPAEVSVWVDTAKSAFSTADLPAGYSFLRDAAETVYLLPLSQDPDLPWPGWSTERLIATLPSGTQLPSGNDAVQLGVAIDGPGEVFTWMSGAFGAVTNRYIDTADPTPDFIPVARNAHVHTAWAFTAPGDYYLTLSPTATTTTGDTITGPSASYHIQVGPIADAAPQVSAAPVISGTGEVGDPLQLNVGGWFPRPHGLTQQWLRDGEPVEGATGTEYTPTQSDDGHAISATVTARIGSASNSAEAPGPVIGGEPGGENPEEPQQTGVTLTGSATGITLGGRVTLTATVSPRGGTVDRPLGFGGTVELYNGSTKVGQTELSNPVAGAVQFIAAPASAGQHGYRARYLPPAPHLLSDSNEVIVTVTAAPDPGPGDPAGEVPNGSLTDSGATILNRGHVDIASLLESGRLVTRVKDTTESATPTWRDPAKTVLQALPTAKTKVPTGESFRFLGASGGDLWLLPETQDHSLLWPGWSTEEIPDAATTTGFDWRLTDIEGPGEFALFTSGAFGEPKVLFNTRDGLPDATVIGKRVHVHGSWAFSAEGVYCLAFDRATTLAGGAEATDEFTIAVAVGQVAVKQVDPGKCFTQPDDKPGADDTVPVPDAELTAGASGGVRVLNAEQGFSAGQLVTVRIGAGRATDWVSLWLHSEPVWLGWAQVDGSGAVQVRLPTNAAAGVHKLVVKDRSGALIGWDELTVTKPASTPSPPADDNNDGGSGKGTSTTKKTSSSKCVNALVLSSGHIDYATRIVSGKLQSSIGDDTGAKKVYREPSAVVLWLKPASKVTLPAGYGQVGSAGSVVWQVPQTQRSGLIWLGWNTELLNAGNARGSVSWKLNSVSGPGSVKIYLSGAFGGVQTMVFSGAGSSYNIPLGVHAHGNWAFSKEGIYRLRMTQSVTLANGQRSSDTETLTIAVGDVDPNAAARCGASGGTQLAAGDTADTTTSLEAAEQAVAEAAILANGMSPGEGAGAAPSVLSDPIEELARGNAVPLLLSILGGLLLTGAVGTGGYWWWRRRWPDLGSPAAGAT